MNSALWLLIGMQLRGWIRYFLRGLLTLRGALLAILGGTFFTLWLLSVAFANKSKGAGDPALVPLYGPSLLLFYCILNVLMSSSERGIYFTPAEVNFLFPAPLGRRALLGYKIASSVIIGLPSCLVLSAISYGYSRSFLNAFLGMVLIVMFMQLFSMALNLLAVTVGARLFTRGRMLLGVAVIVLAAILLWRVGGPENGEIVRWLQQVDRTPEWRTLTEPLTWFFRTFSARRVWPDLIKYASLGLLVNGALLGIVFALDAQYMEAAAAASARIYERIRRVRAGSSAAPTPSRFRIALPMPPALGGIGTLCWRQLTTTLRMPARLVIVFAMFVAVLGATQAMNPPGGAAAPMAVWAGVWVLLMAVFLSAMLPFDFRGDVERIPLLKTLPIPPWRMALGQVLAPVLIVTVLQWFVLTLLYFSGLVNDERVHGSWLWQPGLILLACGLFALPVNGLLFALENLLFLLFPTRLTANNPADFQALGRNVLFMLAKLTVLGVVFVIASMVGIDVGAFFPILGLVMVWLTLAYFVAPLIPLIGWAFTVFDVSRDTPA
jgi:hypothetical protein